MEEKYNSLRKKIFEYVSKTYQSEIEFPWIKFPNYCVFRHKKNKKWYGLIMDIPYAKLGVDKKGIADVLNVKIDDFMLKEFLITQNGIYNGYHMSHDKWISVLLDGTVDINQIYDLINISFVATKKKTKNN